MDMLSSFLCKQVQDDTADLSFRGNLVENTWHANCNKLVRQKQRFSASDQSIMYMLTYKVEKILISMDGL